MKLFLKYKKEIAEGTMLFGFGVEDEGLVYQPGQFVCLKLDLKFPDEKGPVRYFSIVNPAEENGLIEIATRISNTGFKKTLAGLETGAGAEITKIEGRFCLPEDGNQSVAMVAGGVGITPFKCMLESLARKGEKRRITLLYSNKNLANTAFYDEFLTLEIRGIVSKTYFVMTRDDTWPGPKGRINVDFIRENVADFTNCWFMVAGPPNFVSGISQALEELKVGNVSLEKFFGY
jgi:ferredoxin-NADP reductase